MLRKIIPALLVFFIVSCNSTPDIPGYRLIEKRFVKEVNADCYYLEHIKTGARVFKIAAEDPNKTFCVTFKTIPENDYGVPHIFEHAVLNGSEKFQVKSPFDAMAKGSVNTFLNAMTGKDRTYYPAASMNEKDYFNLMNVYYDAVFFPLIFDRPEIFMQEGWHYELADPKDEISIKGVVYNEMKGVFSNPEREIYYQVNKNMFPDNLYGFSSGGYPDSIPQLTREEFLAFHKKFYHPSNAYIYFYGDADIKDELTFIDTAYLSKFDASEIDTEIPLHESPFSEMESRTAFYSVPEGTDTDKKSYTTFNFVIGDGTDLNTGIALEVLTDVLFNLESAPFRLALQEAGLGTNVSAWTYAIRQHFVQVEVQNTNPEDTEAIKELFITTLKEVVEEGIDKEALNGVINRLEFYFREPNDANIGITQMQRNIGNWVHAGDPFTGIEYEKPLAWLKTSLNSDILEQLVQSEFIDNPYSLLLVVEPKPGLEAENAKNHAMAMADLKASMSQDEIDEMVATTKKLLALQNKEDSPEALATIPSLGLEDIDPKAPEYNLTVSEVSGNTLLHYDIFTNSIIYLQYIFDTRVLDEELIPYLSVYREIFGKMNTENYSYEELEKALKINTGGFSAGVNAQPDYERLNENAYTPLFQVSAKTTRDKSSQLVELCSEVLLKTDFTDTSRMKKILTKHLATIESGVKRNGFGYARKRLYSYTSPKGMFNEMTSGLEYYWFLSELVNNFDDKASDLIVKMQTISASLINKNNLDIGVICTSDDLKSIKPLISQNLNAFPSDAVDKKSWNLKPEVKNEGLMTSSKVQYVLQGANYAQMGHSISGHMMVLNKIMNADYLQKEVRVKGGAYGGFGHFLNNGDVFFGSYRDPNLAETLNAYSGIPVFLENYTTDSIELVRSIIGTIGDLDGPMTPEQEGSLAIRRYYNNFSNEKVQTIRDEILGTTLEDIRSFAPLVQKVLDEEAYCVYGNQQKIEENKDLFGTLRKVDE